jgi:hypothetical protein
MGWNGDSECGTEAALQTLPRLNESKGGIKVWFHESLPMWECKAHRG